MKALRRLIFALILFVVFITSTVFVRFNSESTVIVVGNYEVWELPLSALVIGTFVAGGLSGLVLGLRIFQTIKAKAEILTLKNKLRKIEGQLAKVNAKSSRN